MLRFAAISVLILFLFGNCKKEELQELKVSYVVSETSTDSPTFTISYTSDKSGGTTSASSSSASWTSGAIILDKQQFISMRVDCTAPLFNIKLAVYISGYLWQQMEIQNPTSSATISGTP